MTPFEHIQGFLGLSCGFWMLYCLYSILRVQAFIVKRYEHETQLLDTRFFKDHATFTRYLPGFLSSAVYTGHLLMCMWGWKIFGRKISFNDIDTPERITSHFKPKEMNRVKRHAIAILILFLHFLVLSVLL